MEGSTGASAKQRLPAALTTTTTAAPAAAPATAPATAAPVAAAEANPRAAWRAALDEEKLPRLDAEVEAWLDALPTSELHFKDTVPRIERLLREEDYLTLNAVTNALLNRSEVRDGLKGKTKAYFDENLKNRTKRGLPEGEAERNTSSRSAASSPSGKPSVQLTLRQLHAYPDVFPSVYGMSNEQVKKIFEPLGLFAARKADAKKGSKKEEIMYPLWAEVFTAIHATGVCRLRIVESHNDLTLPPLKPDAVAFSATLSTELGKTMPSRIELIGEFKDSATATPPPAHITQLADYARVLFQKEPRRTHVYCFIANASVITFYRFTPSANRMDLPSAEHSETVEINEQGGRILLGLLQRESSFLGAPTLDQVYLDNLGLVSTVSLLGQGRTVYAYSARVVGGAVQSPSFVLKIFKEDLVSRKALEREVEFLGEVKPLLAGPSNRHSVPTVLAVDIDRRVVALEPIGTTLRAAKLLHPQVYVVACGVVSILQVLHQKRIVHRDLSDTNIYILDPNDTARVMLNDFGFATRDGTEEHFTGTRRVAAQAVLACGSGRIIYRCWHDLESLVKLVWTLREPLLGDRLSSKMDPLAVHKIWEDFEQNNRDYQFQVGLARKGDHEALKTEFQKAARVFGY